MPRVEVARPEPGEFAPVYASYIARVHEHPVDAMMAQGHATYEFLIGLDEAVGGQRYAPKKWSVREMIQHLSDAERIFAYRAMRLARGDATPLPGFDENAYVAASGADRHTVVELAHEFMAVRFATVSLFANFDAEAWTRAGIANGVPFTVRALGHVIPGHERHHLTVLRERYGLAAPIKEATN